MDQKSLKTSKNERLFGVFGEKCRKNRHPTFFTENQPENEIFQNRCSQSCEEVFHSKFLLGQWTFEVVENTFFGPAEGFPGSAEGFIQHQF